MPDERDPIDGFAELWRGLEAPRPDDSDAPTDERTEAAVAWMRSAWRELEPPPVVLPFVVRRRRVAKVVLALASAAAVLVAALAALSDRRAAPTVEPPEHLAADSGAGHAPGEAAPHPTGPLAGVSGEIDEQGRVVLRHGRVSLVWLAATARTQDTEPRGADQAPNLENR